MTVIKDAKEYLHHRFTTAGLGGQVKVTHRGDYKHVTRIIPGQEPVEFDVPYEALREATTDLLERLSKDKAGTLSTIFGKPTRVDEIYTGLILGQEQRSASTMGLAN